VTALVRYEHPIVVGPPTTFAVPASVSAWANPAVSLTASSAEWLRLLALVGSTDGEPADSRSSLLRVDIEADQIEETLVEMTYRWGDVENGLPDWTRRNDADLANPIKVGSTVASALVEAFRVEALVDEGVNDYGDEYQSFWYRILFDVEDSDAREAATTVRKEERFLQKVISDQFGGARYGTEVRVCSKGVPAEGQLCGRAWEPPPKKHIDVTDVPTEKPNSNVPLIDKDGYWLTPIEVPFYDALRDTGAIFAVQPWVQGIDSRYRPDFMVFYDGGIVIVELDGHESHKTREQRTRDAKRQRWFEARGMRVLRWTGSEVHANAQDCVRDLLEIVRGKQARF
jgi:hypothetical protein